MIVEAIVIHPEDEQIKELEDKMGLHLSKDKPKYSTVEFGFCIADLQSYKVLEDKIILKFKNGASENVIKSDSLYSALATHFRK